MASKQPLAEWQNEDAQRLRGLFSAAGMTQAEFGAEYEIGVQGMVWQYLNAKRPLNIDACAKFAKGLGVSINQISPTIAHQIASAWLLTDEAKNLQRTGISSGPVTGLQRVVTDTVDAANQEEYVPVRRASVKIVGGDPVITVDLAGSDFNGVIKLSKTWLQKRGLKAESVFVATVAGDSMQPCIHEGDLLLLNQTDTTKRDGRVYGFAHDGRFVVKRLRKDGHRWLLTSDNPEYAPIEAIEATKVVGRVVLMQGEGI